MTKANGILREAFIGFLGVIIGGGIVAVASYAVNERQIDVKMIEIAVALLKEDPSGPLQPARKWAADVIQKYSDPRLSDSAYQALINCRLVIDLDDKFGRIGATASKRHPDYRAAKLIYQHPACRADPEVRASGEHRQAAHVAL